MMLIVCLHDIEYKFVHSFVLFQILYMGIASYAPSTALEAG